MMLQPRQEAPPTVDANGARIPALGMGTWQLRGRVCEDRVADALAIGYRHVDTASMYENHERVGRGVRASGVDREELFLTTKLWLDDLRPYAVRASTERALRELGTDYVDLLLVHWPNPDVPLPSTIESMMELVERDRVRSIGVSNFPPSWVERAAAAGPVVCDEVEYHPLLSQDHLLAPLRARGMALLAYSPLAHGEALDEPLLQRIGDAHGKTAAQVSLRWLLSQEGVAAIPKASSREHLEEDFAVFDFDLDGDEQARIHDLAERRGRRTVDPDFAPRWER